MQLAKILHVEDDESIRIIVEMALVDLSGFTLCACESGVEAIAQVEQFAPHLILLDAMMPGMDGLQTLVKLRGKDSCRQTPVVFMTARIQQAVKQQYFDAGAVAGLAVEQFRRPAFGLEEIGVHAQEHFRPIAAFGAAGAGLHGHEHVAAIIATRQSEAKFELIVRGIDRVEIRTDFGQGGLVAAGQIL